MDRATVERELFTTALPRPSSGAFARADDAAAAIIYTSGVRPIGRANATTLQFVLLEGTTRWEEGRMRTSRVSFTAAATLLLLAAGCARSPAPAASPSPATSSASDSDSASRAIAVQVDNQNFAEMDVYLLNGGARWLVGQVGGMTKRTLTVPASLVPADGQLRFRAEAIGGAGATTTPVLMVPPGQQVYWTIGSDPSMSSASAG